MAAASAFFLNKGESALSNHLWKIIFGKKTHSVYPSVLILSVTLNLIPVLLSLQRKYPFHDRDVFLDV